MSNHASFLPEDYIAQKAERRTNLISLVLFAIVMLGILLAFLFTNQRASQVKKEQRAINARYESAAEQIQGLGALEDQKSEMMQKAALAAALVERVPRSILLAEIINRMPDRLSLLEFELKSERIKNVPLARALPGGHARSRTPARALSKSQAHMEKQRVEPPRYNVKLVLKGVAPTDLEVSKFLDALDAYPLLRTVTLKYSEEKQIEGSVLREFQFNATLESHADVRDVEPLVMPRGPRNPMTDRLRFDAVNVNPDMIRIPGGEEN